MFSEGRNFVEAGSLCVRGLVLLGLAFIVGEISGLAIPLTGSNGNVVDFAGVKSASPAGLRVQVKADDPLLDVGWEKFDLSKLESENPEIHQAYQEALAGKHTELNLGAFAPKDQPAMREQKNYEDGAERHGWFETGAAGGKFAIQLPETEPKSVLLVSMGVDGRSIRYMGGVGASRWKALTEKFHMAVMSYEFDLSKKGETFDPSKDAPFIYTDAGSGDGVISALEQFAEKSGKTRLKTIPIAVFGADVLGAAFSYNFVQSHPDRVIAAVASKGAFYLGAPSENSAKVPLLLLWGEYDSDIKRWNPTDTHEQAYENSLNLFPNWIHAMEPRGGPGESPLSFEFGRIFLDRMMLARMSPNGELLELDRSKAWVGNLQTREIRRMEDPEKVLEAHETWLPNGEVAKLWEDFSTGSLDLNSQ